MLLAENTIRFASCALHLVSLSAFTEQQSKKQYTLPVMSLGFLAHGGQKPQWPSPTELITGSTALGSWPS